MNNLKEYIENLDKKNFIMLVVSILVLWFIAIYYLNNIFTKNKQTLFRKKMELLKKIEETRILDNKIVKIKNKHKILKTKYQNLSSDLIYLLSEIESSDVLMIKNSKFLKILHNYIAIGANVNASFKIKQVNKLNKYNIEISGNFSPIKFLDFAYFIKTIESPKAIITINNLNVFKFKNKIFYDFNVTIWSFR